MTQEQLVEYMGVSPQAIGRWETEATYPDIFALPFLAEYETCGGVAEYVLKVQGGDHCRNEG